MRVGAVGQVAALLRLRVATVRGPGRARAAAGIALFPGVAAVGVAGGTLLPRGAALNVALLMPTAWLLFAVGAVTAATTGAGGRRLLPRDQSVAFPISPSADHLGALLLAPVSVAWFTQAVGLLAVTSWVIGPDVRLVAAQGLTMLWILTCTVVAQALGWLVELTRSTRAGVWALRVLVATSVTVAVVIGVQGRVTQVLDRAPTQRYVGPALAGFGRPGQWCAAVAELLLASVVAWAVGVRLLEWLTRRPAAAQARVETRGQRRRPDSSSAWAAMVRLDRAGVWRSAPLRRGLAVLALVPGGVATATGLDWPLVTLLPGLVASGAGLLFGVNAFALDSSGALWRASLPGSQRTTLLVRLGVVAEVCLVSAAVAVLAAASRAGAPTAAELTAVLGAWLAASAQVVAWCGYWSVHRPYAAELRDSRDQPAPPAAMAGYSARLALSTTITGLLFWAAAQSGVAATGVSLALAVLLLSARRLVRTLRRWQDPAVQAHVLFTVAGSRG